MIQKKRFGKNIILPKDPSYVWIQDLDINRTKRSYIRNAVNNMNVTEVTHEDLEFLAKDTKSNLEFVKEILDELGVKY